VHIAVIRKWLTPESTISEVRINGDRVCYGLEDAIREVDGQPVESWKIKGETAIPYGAYQLEITRSTRWKKDMLQVMDVPGFSGIRIHAGNTSADTEGCLLVGDIKGDDFISNSRPALVRVFGAVQAALHRGDEVTIEFQRE
jgi:hypothetical protein